MLRAILGPYWGCLWPSWGHVGALADHFGHLGCDLISYYAKSVLRALTSHKNGRTSFVAVLAGGGKSMQKVGFVR